MPFDLSGRRSLVTGSGRGIGRAIAIALAEAGADVAITSRKADEAGSTVAEIHAKGRRAVAIELDVRDGASIRACFARIAGGRGVAANRPDEILEDALMRNRVAYGR